MSENGPSPSGSNTGSGASGGSHQGKSNEEVISTKSLKIGNKRFYLDLKQNARGKFIKVAEVGIAGRKARILLSIPTAVQFRDRLTQILVTYNELPPHDPSKLAPEGRLHSNTLVWDYRRYYLDLKENERGRFLRITMISPGPRCQIAIPGQGIEEVKDELGALLKEIPEDEQESIQPTLPQPRAMRVDHKMFYFDVGANRRGVFLRVSEVRPDYRTAVTIPQHSWGRFRDILNELAEFADAKKVQQNAGGDSSLQKKNNPVTTTDESDKLTSKLDAIKLEATSPGKDVSEKNSPAKKTTENN